MAATLAVAWLCARGTRTPVAMACGWIFFLDPFLVAGYRGGRVDCWALAACFGCCWILSSLRYVGDHRRRYIGIALAGALAVLGFLFWPSVVMSFPVIVAEAVLVVREWAGGKRLLQWSVRVLSLFAAGPLVTGALVTIPVWHVLQDMISDLLLNANNDLQLRGPRRHDSSRALPDATRAHSLASSVRGRRCVHARESSSRCGPGRPTRVHAGNKRVRSSPNVLTACCTGSSRRLGR